MSPGHALTPTAAVQDEDPLWSSSSPLPLSHPTPSDPAPFWQPRAATTSLSARADLKRYSKGSSVSSAQPKTQAGLRARSIPVRMQCLEKTKQKTNASNPTCLVGTDILLRREITADASATARGTGPNPASNALAPLPPNVTDFLLSCLKKLVRLKGIV